MWQALLLSDSQRANVGEIIHAHRHDACAYEFRVSRCIHCQSLRLAHVPFDGKDTVSHQEHHCGCARPTLYFGSGYVPVCLGGTKGPYITYS